MLDPQGLYAWEPKGLAVVDMALAQESAGLVMLYHFDGYIDAGETGDQIVDRILDSQPHQVVARFDHDRLVDYRARRPPMVFDTNRWVEYDDPAMLLHRLTDRDGQTYYLLTGPEPDFQWERVVEAIRELVVTLGVTLVVHTHGIPMGVPHTRPVGMTAHATNAALIGDTASPFGRVQVPGSIGALLELRLGEAGHDAVGFAIHVPHYLAGSEWAEGALASLNAIVDVTGLNLPNDDLVMRARANQQAIAAEVDGNDEARAVVTALEQQYDTYLEGRQRPSLLATEASQIPSADELGEDFENFLRSVNDDDQA